MRLPRLTNDGSRVETGGQVRFDNRLHIVAVEREPIDRTAERIPPRLIQQQIAQRLGVDLGAERSDQPRVGGAVLDLDLQRAEQRLNRVSPAERGGARVLSPPLPGARPLGTRENDQHGTRQRQKGESHEPRSPTRCPVRPLAVGPQNRLPINPSGRLENRSPPSTKASHRSRNTSGDSLNDSGDQLQGGTKGLVDDGQAQSVRRAPLDTSTTAFLVGTGGASGPLR